MCLYCLPDWKLQKIAGKKKCKLNVLNCQMISLRTTGISAPSQSKCCATQASLVQRFFWLRRKVLTAGENWWVVLFPDLFVGDSIALFISSVLPGEHLAADTFPEGDELWPVLQLFRGWPAQALSQAVPATQSLALQGRNSWTVLASSRTQLIGGIDGMRRSRKSIRLISNWVATAIAKHYLVNYTYYHVTYTSKTLFSKKAVSPCF